mmetsp:Transcript_3260/g.6283  ORF Transcript_3260/g.6283 Transcript_3260/m.6283 type:complete len:107 (+) Transcript_3260:518-838(+)
MLAKSVPLLPGLLQHLAKRAKKLQNPRSEGTKTTAVKPAKHYWLAIEQRAEELPEELFLSHRPRDLQSGRTNVKICSQRPVKQEAICRQLGIALRSAPGEPSARHE